MKLQDRSRNLAVFAATAALAFAAVSATAQAYTYDLGEDWSDLTNPFGPWRLEKNHLQDLFAINLNFFGSGQLVWADGFLGEWNHVPLWTKIIDPFFAGDFIDCLPGDVMMHGAEFDRTGTNVTSAVFVSPVAGTAVISGWVWDALHLGRTKEWRLYKNDVELTSGILDDNTTRLNPMYFASGSGGPGALTRQVQVGDRLELRCISLSEQGNLGSHVGVKFAVEVNSATTVVATTTSLSPGFVYSGTPVDLNTSNNFYYVLRPGITFAFGQNPIVLTASYTLPSGNASALSAVIESRAQQASTRQTIEVFDFTTNSYDQLDQRLLPTADTVVTSPLSPAPNYIGAGNEVRLRISYKAVGPMFSYPWRALVDEATLRFTP